jgi:hypothetical protein
MSSPATAYDDLVAHAELELELAGRGDVEQLATLDDRWQALVASLPERPPPEAGPALERAGLLHERTRIELIRLREALLNELASAATAKRAVVGYEPATGGPRVDRSA